MSKNMKETNSQQYTAPGSNLGTPTQQLATGCLGLRTGNANDMAVAGIIKQEPSEPDPDLEEIVGRIHGELVPLTSTPNRPSQSWSDSNSSYVTPTALVSSPIPWAQSTGRPTETGQPFTPRMLFQDEAELTASPSRSAGQRVATSLSTPSKQLSINDFLGSRRASRHSLSEMRTCDSSGYQASSPGSPATTPLRSSAQTASVIPLNKKRRTPFHTPEGSSPKTPKRNGNSKRSNRTNSTRRRQRINNDSSFEGVNSPNRINLNESITLETSEHEDEQEEEESSRDTVPHFSIHRLPVSQLSAKYDGDTEEELIDKMMNKINADMKSRYKDKKRNFEKRPATSQEKEATATQVNTTFNFNIVVYLQKVECEIAMLSQLGIPDKNVNFNSIIFYYRENDIFALTNGHTWQAIQPFCCYDFPCQISGRLTSAEGNVEETIKQLVGIIRTSRSTKKNATMLNQLKNVRLNFIKEVRKDSSLLHLKEFQANKNDQRSPTKGGSGHVKIQMGLAYVRIKKKIDLKNLPEVLDHFSKICCGENTFRYPDRRLESHIDESPLLRLVSRDDAQDLENSLYKLIHKFMHNQHKSDIRKFDFVDKHVDDWSNAEEITITYNNGGNKSYTVAKFTSCPTALQVLTAVRSSCGEELTKDGITLQKFSYRLKSHVKVQYVVREQEPRVRRLVDLLEGEMSFYGKDFWKIMGQWCYVRDEYYYNIYKEFLDLLNKPNTYINCEHLREPWDRTKIKTVQEYVQLYREDNNYFLPPIQEEMEAMNSQPVANNEHENTDCDEELVHSTTGDLAGNYFFDMIRIEKQKDGNCAFWLFYIFDSFDAGIRDASTRIIKSIEMLLKDYPVTSTKSLLEKFYDHYSTKSNDFRALFPLFKLFQQPLTTGNRVHIVVAFATEHNSPQEIGPLSRFTIPQGETSVSPTLYDEKRLQLTLKLELIEQILNDFEQKHKDEMCQELKILSDSEAESCTDLLATKVIELLKTAGYCEKSKDFGDPVLDSPVTGKLLKMRNSKDFKIFKNDEVNKLLFNALRKHYITGFPGFIHKLECFQIYENVAKEVRLNLNFAEINSRICESNL